MANLKSSKKKVRKDIKRTKANVVYKSKIDQVLHAVKKAAHAGTTIDVVAAYKLIDKASKSGIFSKQKASRLKSQVASK
jgi:ribosomal protein S20